MAVHKPRGFRDSLFGEAQRREALSARVGAFFAEAGYELVETPSVEYLETLNARTGGVPADGVHEGDLTMRAMRDTFRFVDVDGRLLALRSDVTIPLARVVAARFAQLEPPYRLRYRSDVFREQESLRGSERQFTQLGIECFGLAAQGGDAEVLTLALGGLAAAGVRGATLHLCDAGVLRALVAVADDADWQERFAAAWRGGDFIALRELAFDGTLPEAVAQALTGLLRLRGGAAVLEQAQSLLAVCPAAMAPLDALRCNYQALCAAGRADQVIVDFSLTPAFDYYSGLVFELYAPVAASAAAPAAVATATTAAVARRSGVVLGSGGRYDTLLRQFGRDLPAAGFAYELSALERALDQQTPPRDGSDGDTSDLTTLTPATPPPATITTAPAATPATPATPPLRIAVPKGKLYADSIALLRAAGITLDGLDNPGRTLRLQNDAYELIIAKPSDVAIYVSRGAADVGIGGRDILVEADFPLLQLVDLHFGQCAFVVAAPSACQYTLDELALKLGTIRAATKYPRLTQTFFDSRGLPTEIVKLNGNIELAPLIGIADVIVDITQTGTTLRENDLRIVESVLPSTARFVANALSYRSDARVRALAENLERIVTP